MIRSILALLLLTAPVYAEPAAVYTGEHGDYTRLVVELPATSGWTVGRMPDGYAFAATATRQPEFDLSGVWQRIARTRLSALSVDPESGALMLTLGCACHVFPFEHRPGVIVLDIKPGPPPTGSVFEEAFALEGTSTSEPVSTSGTIAATGYDWLTGHATTAADRKKPNLPMPLATGDVSLDPLHNALLEQIARGASDGVVEMAMPERNREDPVANKDLLPWASIRFGELPGITVNDPDTFVEGKTPGASCAEDTVLDLASWGTAGTPLDLLAAARSGLYGEFDAPDPETVTQSVRLHLFLGFGAEAGQQAELVAGMPEDDTLALYQSMARIVDGDTDAETPFAVMLDCDGHAALWAALARDRLPAGPGVNRDAILRSFLALPSHLRSHLGSALAEKFLKLDDPDAVRVIRDAMERSAQADPTSVAILDAETELHRGDADAALNHALTAVSLDGNRAEALVALVEAHFRKLQPVNPEVTQALLALRGESGGTGMADAVDRAIVVSMALSGKTESAMQDPTAKDGTLADLWHIVQYQSGDDVFLRNAVLPPGSPLPNLAPELDLAIADRLQSLGFPDAALTWIGELQPDSATEARVVAAQAWLHQGDASRAIDLLVGLGGREVEKIRGTALLQLGDLPDAAARTRVRKHDWSSLEPGTPDPWQAVAREAEPLTPGTTGGLLAAGAHVLAASVASREAVAELLNAVASPADD